MKLDQFSISPMIGIPGVKVTSASRYLEGEYPDEATFRKKKQAYDYGKLRVSLGFCLVAAKRLWLNGYVKGLGIKQALNDAQEIEVALPHAMPVYPETLQPKLEQIIFVLSRFEKVNAPPSYDISNDLEFIRDYYNAYCKAFEPFNDSYLAK